MTTDTREPVALMLRRYAVSREPKLRDEIIERHDGLVRSLARKFARPGVQVEDLTQTAWIALIRAFDRFDPTRGNQFATYAVTCMVGEIKRHFRDRSWSLKMPRELQDLALRVQRTREKLEIGLGRSPTVSEVAQTMHVSEELVSEAMEAYGAYCPLNLDAARRGRDGQEIQTLAESVGLWDPAMEGLTERDSVASAIATLAERDQRLIHRRFFDGWTQQEVADELGISQMHVSRLERQALGRLRPVLRAEVAPPCCGEATAAVG